MRRFWPAMLALLMLFASCMPAVQAEEEEDISFHELINAVAATPEPDPDATPGPTAAPSPTPEPVLQADGTKLVTITCVGDVTIGHDVLHERKGNGIFDKELKKQNGDVNFIFRNVKKIFEADDLTIAYIDLQQNVLHDVLLGGFFLNCFQESD